MAGAQATLLRREATSSLSQLYPNPTKLPLHTSTTGKNICNRKRVTVPEYSTKRNLQLLPQLALFCEVHKAEQSQSPIHSFLTFLLLQGDGDKKAFMRQKQESIA